MIDHGGASDQRPTTRPTGRLGRNAMREPAVGAENLASVGKLPAMDVVSGAATNHAGEPTCSER